MEAGRMFTLHDSPVITVWYRPEPHTIHHRFHTHPYGEAFRAGLMAGIHGLRRFNTNRWLSDDRLYGPVSPEDEAWLDNVWGKQALAAGWKYWAQVLPQSVIGRMNAQRLATHSEEKGIVHEIFSEVEPALHWLNTLDRSDVRRSMSPK